VRQILRAKEDRIVPGQKEEASAGNRDVQN
jgi:hypothetical protein